MSEFVWSCPKESNLARGWQRIVAIPGMITLSDTTCRGAFIPFIMAGDPDLETTEKAILALDEVGADVIELGVPYSVSINNYLRASSQVEAA